jgi:ubiquinone/menaquinone biosynthesis C-methylase UbiE
MSKIEPDRETIDTWNKVATLYEDKFMNLTIYDHTYQIFLELASKTGSSVLDVGCGPGNITRYLLDKRPDLKITGVDAAPRMIELARKNNPSAKFMEMDCRRINSVREKFNGVVIGFCLPYLSESDCMKLIADCYSLLEDEGILYLSFVSGEPHQSGYQTGSNGQRMFFYYHTSADLQKMLLENGLVIVNTMKVNYTKSPDLTEEHTVIIARKNAGM